MMTVVMIRVSIIIIMITVINIIIIVNGIPYRIFRTDKIINFIKVVFCITTEHLVIKETEKNE